MSLEKEISETKQKAIAFIKSHVLLVIIAVVAVFALSIALSEHNKAQNELDKQVVTMNACIDTASHSITDTATYAKANANSNEANSKKMLITDPFIGLTYGVLILVVAALIGEFVYYMLIRMKQSKQVIQGEDGVYDAGEQARASSTLKAIYITCALILFACVWMVIK